MSDAPQARSVARWLPLFFLLVVSATTFPYTLHCALGGLDLDAPIPRDVLQNLVLFAPLGVALRHGPARRPVWLGAALSLLVETSQFFVLRSPTPWDLLVNTLGAWLGWRLTQGEAPALGPLLRLVAPIAPAQAALALALFLFGFCAVSRSLVLGDGFEDWDPMPLQLGNEANSSRPWPGRIAELAVYDHVPEERSNVEIAPHSGAWRDAGPILWLRFEEPAAGRIDGPAGPVPVDPAPAASSQSRLASDGLVLSGGRHRLPSVIASHVHERLVASGRLALFLRLRPADLETTGPGRILSASLDESTRTFMLGQQQENLVFRVRLPFTSDNGTRPDTQTFSGPLDGSEQSVWAMYDGVYGRIEVDGRCRGERLMAGREGFGPLGEPMGATLVTGCGLAAIGAAGSRRRASRRRRVIAGLGAGTAFLTGLWAMGAWAHLPGFDVLAPCVGIVATLLGCYAGLDLAPRFELDDTRAGRAKR